jgi:hypothetical protein
MLTKLNRIHNRIKNSRVTVQSEQLGRGVSKFTTSNQDCIQEFYVNLMFLYRALWYNNVM